jgi:hypothetical protein
MSQLGQSLPKRGVRATSAFPPIATELRTWREAGADLNQGIVRPNRDTLYSFAVFDFDAGPVTVTLPDSGKRFMVMQVVNEDQYTPAVFYGAGSDIVTRDGIGTRYGIVVVHMLVDPTNPQDPRDRSKNGFTSVHVD